MLCCQLPAVLPDILTQGNAAGRHPPSFRYSSHLVDRIATAVALFVFCFFCYPSVSAACRFGKWVDFPIFLAAPPSMLSYGYCMQNLAKSADGTQNKTLFAKKCGQCPVFTYYSKLRLSAQQKRPAFMPVFKKRLVGNLIETVKFACFFHQRVKITLFRDDSVF